MISQSLIEQLTKKYQTTETNVSREYCQHLFLSYLYQKKKSENILFKGGTALRVVYNSTRFSEDLDFTCFNIKIKELENIFLNTISDVENTGIAVNVEESKTTSGGYLSIFNFEFLSYKETVRIECSFRHKIMIEPDIILVNSDYIPSFNVLCLPLKQLMVEKSRALLDRGKPRDFYDIYFLLRLNAQISKGDLELAQVLQRLDTTRIDFKKELKKLLPKNHHMILKSFRNILKNEIKRQGY